MQDFNDFIKNGETNVGSENIDPNIFNLVNSLASKYDGKSQNELMKAIYEQAKRGKQNGTLTNTDIDNFANMLSPLLDVQKRKMLIKIVAELKKI
jgi:hypothetical protein